MSTQKITTPDRIDLRAPLLEEREKSVKVRKYEIASKGNINCYCLKKNVEFFFAQLIEWNPYQIPPDWKMAKDHSVSSI